MNKTNNLVKTILCFIILSAAIPNKAQTLDSIPHIGIGEHHVFPACIMQMADSTILGSCIVFEDQDSNYSAWFLNRISRHGAHLI